ncbi:hypothetical protein SAMN05444920_111107 [Nonomuraea solani]|uniref:Uncharacterized protein n=1 Tax=Nonomuraea solani TaxID=1144553 RepID=A0A1H6EJ75_9ACTN|nr:hypothetical protein [Nonomuraea solani]SEG97902.1 hypothetical protein SAMN05444920_111107 [Nonomuraea solani]
MSIPSEEPRIAEEHGTPDPMSAYTESAQEKAEPPLPPWFCVRLGPVSGRYQGYQTTNRTSALDCRVDIDPRGGNSPVTNRVSGDFHDVFTIQLPGRPPIIWRRYRESWIIDAPRAHWSRCDVTITGEVRFWKGTHPLTQARIRIPWGTLTPAGPAEITFSENGGAVRTYHCPRTSVNFREMTLEVDVCNSVNVAPQLPAYHTHAHSNRPANVPGRTITVESAYQEAGVGLTVNTPAHTIFDDANSSFSTWSAPELHDAMETAFSQFAGGWPRWSMWGFMAGTFDNSGVAGIMFDAAAAFGGAGEAPERQGFALFRRHSWFNNLPTGAPANDAQAAALRDFLYTYVHEAGHAFNFLHSWDKGRPDSLSWMNYPWRYDLRNGTDTFWNRFLFRFDDQELIHMRHGDMASVIMGGDAWSSGGHLEQPQASEAFSVIEGQPPVELLLRAEPPVYDLMERVTVEARLRNLLNVPMEIDTNLDPAYGSMSVFIQRPDGRVHRFEPIMSVIGIPETATLQSTATATTGDDRYSHEIDLTYSRAGFMFTDPGTYRIRATYHGPSGILAISNVLTIRVLTPASRQDEIQAADFFTDQVGLSIALGGSASPHLSKGLETLTEVAQRHGDRLIGARAAEILTGAYGRAFNRVTDYEQGTLSRVKEAEPQRAIELTQPALDLYRNSSDRRLNLAYHNLVRKRADLLAEADNAEQAQRELRELHDTLEQRKVRPNVLDQIRMRQEKT